MKLIIALILQLIPAFVYAQDACTKTGQGNSSMMKLMFPMLLIFVVWYFLLIRPQQKKEKNRKALISAIKKGDKIITIGGIYGSVVEVKEKTVVIKVSSNSSMEFLKSAVSTVDIKEKK